MWLQPALKLIATAASRIYYRLEIHGHPVSATGSALLVANHPNGLLDPALVIAATQRNVRFLAKSTLFSDLRLGWLVRGGGAIPVYRKIDGPTEEVSNQDAFDAVFEALGEGDAVGIFPEGVSHSDPSLARLKTGAARMALGTFAREGEVFPIVPIGLVLRRKEVFRSRAIVVLGEPVEWSDLAPRGPEDRVAVAELTRRISVGLRRVTVNLEQWEDAPLVEWVEAVWAAERGTDDRPTGQIDRLSTITTILKALRRQRESAPADAAVAEATELAAELHQHRARLTAIGLEPQDLSGHSNPRLGIGTYRPLDPVSAVVAFVGFFLFWVPYQLTGRLAALAKPPPEVRSTYQLLIGIVVYALWMAVSIAAVGWRFGWLAAGGTTAALPLLGLLGLWIRERRRAQQQMWRKVSGVLSRREWVPELQARQSRIAERLAKLFERWERGEIHARSNFTTVHKPQSVE